MKKLIGAGFLVLAAVLVCAACTSPPPDIHTTRISVDWEGRYTGTLPGANSDIKTEITLNRDETYQASYQYVDKGSEVFTESGTFTWKEDGEIIVLDSKDLPPYYKVGENQIIQLDMKGKFIKGKLASMYVLTKQ